MTEERNTLPKNERLCGKKGISQLLAEGRYGNTSDIRFRYLPDNGKEENRIMISVPKKLFKRAVKRNLLKRRIRESYRTQKHLITSSTKVDIFFMYSTKQIMEYQDIHDKVKEILTKINDNLNRQK